MLSAATKTHQWVYTGHELGDPDLLDKLMLSLCDVCAITYPHFRLQLLLNELINNAINHGVLQLPSNIKDSTKGFDRFFTERANRLRSISGGYVSIEAERLSENSLRISVQDSGAGFDAIQYLAGTCSEANTTTSDIKLHGRGLAIIHALSESVAHAGCGNITVVEFNVSHA